jgi:processive 1,2-diacylglycerol beta-glucosyltransferase
MPQHGKSRRETVAKKLAVISRWKRRWFRLFRFPPAGDPLNSRRMIPPSRSADTARRVLIPTVTVGAGHVQAAAALEEAWRALRPQDTVQRLDVLEFMPRLYRNAYLQGYLKLVAHAPELWGAVFRKTDNPKRLRRLNRVRTTLSRLNTPKFVRAVKQFAPDVVVATHFLPTEILDALRSKKRLQPWPFIASVVTDFEAHALWLVPSVELYCVAAEHTRARLLAREVPPTQAVVTGIPIATRFQAIPTRRAARKQLGLRDDLPVLLVLGGGFGLGPVGEIVAALQKLAQPVQIAVVCGRNEKLRRELAVQEHRQPTHLLGFVGNMQDWMAAADLVLTKPGGLTTSEALAVGRPVVVLNPIPGQEEANSDFLLEQGAAIKVNRPEDLPFRLGELLGSPRLKELTARAKALGQPDAAAAVCAAVLARL